MKLRILFSLLITANCFYGMGTGIDLTCTESLDSARDSDSPKSPIYLDEQLANTIQIFYQSPDGDWNPIVYESEPNEGVTRGQLIDFISERLGLLREDVKAGWLHPAHDPWVYHSRRPLFELDGDEDELIIEGGTEDDLVDFGLTYEFDFVAPRDLTANSPSSVATLSP